LKVFKENTEGFIIFLEKNHFNKNKIVSHIYHEKSLINLTSFFSKNIINFIFSGAKKLKLNIFSYKNIFKFFKKLFFFNKHF
jgi:hypothetical protein